LERKQESVKSRIDVQQLEKKHQSGCVKSDSKTGDLCEDEIASLIEEQTCKKRERSCVMSDSKTGDIIHIFSSCSQAERITGINRSIISEACDRDGHRVDQFCFRFISVDSTESSNSNVAKSSKVQGGFNGETKDIDAVMESSSGKKDDTPQLNLVQQQLEKLQHLSSRGPFHPPTKLHFDVLALQPLKSKASPKKKCIQLHCKGSNGKVLLCFQGSSDAANALGIKRKVVNSMCERSKNGEEVEGAPRFDTYSLSIASNRSSPNVYLYGTHKEDWTALPPIQNWNGSRDDREGSRETYHGRLERWEETFLKERNLEVKTDLNQKKNDVPNNCPSVVSATTKDALYLNKQEDSNPFTGYHPNSFKSSVSTKMPVQSQLLTKEENGDMCIVCQKNRANIVFEPCQHCVVCTKCFRKGLCTKFCPSCSLKIHSTTQSSFFKVMKPRIYLANFFM